MSTYGFNFIGPSSDKYSLAIEMVSSEGRGSSNGVDLDFEEELKVDLKKSLDYKYGYFNLPPGNKGGNDFIKLLKKHGFKDVGEMSIKEFDNMQSAVDGVKEFLREYRSRSVNESKCQLISNLLDINESLLEDVNESISLTWSGDSKWSDKWTKAVQVKYKDEIGKFVKELSIKLDGNPYWILVFQNASIIGRTVEDGTGSLEYFCQGQSSSVIGTKKIETFKSDGMVMGQSKGGLHFIKIPDKVFSMKQLMEWWKKIHASYEADGQVDTPQAMSMSGAKDFNQILKDIQGYLSGPSWKSNIPYEIGFGSSSNIFLVLLDSTPVIKFLKGTGDLFRLDTSAVKSRGVVTPSIATGEILGMMESQLGVKAQTTASTSASRINQMVGTHENPDVNMMRNPFDDRW